MKFPGILTIKDAFRDLKQLASSSKRKSSNPVSDTPDLTAWMPRQFTQQKSWKSLELKRRIEVIESFSLEAKTVELLLNGIVEHGGKILSVYVSKRWHHSLGNMDVLHIVVDTEAIELDEV